MFISGAKFILSLFVLSFLLTACVEVREAGKSVGHAAKELGVAIGHGSRDAAKAVSKETAEVMEAAAEGMEAAADDMK